MKQAIKQQRMWFKWHKQWLVFLGLLAFCSSVLVCHGISATTGTFTLQNSLFDRFHFLVVYFPFTILITLLVQQTRSVDIAATGTRRIIFYQRLMRTAIIQTEFCLLWLLLVCVHLSITAAIVHMNWLLFLMSMVTVWVSQLLVNFIVVCLMVHLRSKIAALIVTWLILAGLFLIAVNHIPTLIFAFSVPQTPLRSAGNDVMLIGLILLSVSRMDALTTKEVL